MSAFFDEMRDLTDELMEEFAVAATLTRVVGKHDPRTDRAERHEFPISCLGVLSARKQYAANGLLVHQTVAKLTAKPEIGDKLKIGPSTYTVDHVEEIAPDGKPIIWMAVLR
ncbi:hypothetical protein [Brevundimonas sp. NPDC058933]|uniref:hypothetical protein n=1 Tax=Brevundimonas sp. NPDC058933 TaxID=3346673 RepID=UPI003BEECC95